MLVAQLIVNEAFWHFHTFQQLDYSDFNYNIFENAATAEVLFGRSLAGFVEVVKEWEGYEPFVPHLEDFRANYLSKVLKTYSPNRNEFGFNVLNHADFHLRNLLFKKNADGEIEDFKFVSFLFDGVVIFQLIVSIQSDRLSNLQLCNASNWLDLRNV